MELKFEIAHDFFVPFEIAPKIPLILALRSYENRPHVRGGFNPVFLSRDDESATQGNESILRHQRARGIDGK